MNFILLWFGSGILGTICALLAWKKLIGYVTYGRLIANCIIIPTGILGLILGVFMLFDAYIDFMGFGSETKLPKFKRWTNKKLF